MKSKSILILIIHLLFISSKVYSTGLSGLKTINPNGTGINNFNSFKSAIDTLNFYGVDSGGVEFLISNDLTEKAPFGGYRITATGTSTRRIRFYSNLQFQKPTIIAYNNGLNLATDNTQDGILSIIGSDYLTIEGISFIEDTSNTTPYSQMEYGIGLFKNTNQDGCQYNEIKFCDIKLNSSNTIISTSPSVSGSTGILLCHTNINCIPCNLYPPLISTKGNSFNKFSSNIIENCNNGIAIIGYYSTNINHLDVGNIIGGHTFSEGNKIKNFGFAINIGANTISSNGIYIYDQKQILIENNEINNNNGKGINPVNDNLYGIKIKNTLQSFPSNILIKKNLIKLKNSGNNKSFFGIHASNCDVIQLDSNILDSFIYVGNYEIKEIGIYASSTSKFIFKNNIIKNFRGESLSTNSTITLKGFDSEICNKFFADGNSISNLSMNDYGIIYGICFHASDSVRFSNNNIFNINTNTTTDKSNVRGLEIHGNNVNIARNNIYNIKSNDGNNNNFNIIGLSCIGSNTYVSENSIFNIESNGIITGLMDNSQSNGILTHYRNNVYNLTSKNSDATGVLIAGDSADISTYKIYNIASNSAAGIVKAFDVFVLKYKLNLYNNFISNLSTPVANNTANSIIVFDIRFNNTLKSKIYNNSVYINGSSNGSNFSSTILLHTGRSIATENTTTIANNIFINTSTPKGSGITSIIYNKNNNIINFLNESNRNVYYLGSLSANKFIYYDNTGGKQTLSSFQQFFSPRENQSYYSSISFVNAANNNLHISNLIPSVAESGGKDINELVYDFDGDIRTGPLNLTYQNGFNMDIGADEFDGINIEPYGDINPPLIYIDTVFPSLNDCSTSRHNLNFSIYDKSAIDSCFLYWKDEYNSKLNKIQLIKISKNKYSTILPSLADTLISYYFTTKDSLQNEFVSKTFYYKPTRNSFQIIPSKIFLPVGDTLNLMLITKNELRIGAGNSQSSNTQFKGNVYPTNLTNGKIAFHISAKELQDEGGVAGPIKSISFYVDSILTPGTLLENYKIKLFNTSQSPLPNSYIDSGTIVFGPKTYTPILGINKHVFQTPFIWDGVSNIIVDICFYNTTNPNPANLFSIKNRVHYRKDYKAHSSTAFFNLRTAICGYSGSLSNLVPNIYLELEPRFDSLRWIVDSNSISKSPYSTSNKIIPQTDGQFTYKLFSIINGCERVDSIKITVFDIPKINIDSAITLCYGDSVILNVQNKHSIYEWTLNDSIISTSPIISIKKQGVYRVTVTNIYGIIITDSIEIIENKNLDPELVNNTINLCFGDTYILRAKKIDGVNYLWNNGSTSDSIIVNNQGWYSVIVSDKQFNCSFKDSVYIKFNPLPISTFTIDSTSGRYVEFRANSTIGLQFNWNFGDTASVNNTSNIANPAHLFSFPGDDFKMTLTTNHVATNCFSSTTEFIKFSSINLLKTSKDFNLKAKPNPFINKTLLCYELSGISNNVSLEVLDILGRRVASILENQKQIQGKYEFEFDNFNTNYNSAIYIVKLSVNGNETYLKVIPTK